MVSVRDRHQRLWSVIKATLQEQRNRQVTEALALQESLSFYVYRTDTNAVLARGIIGFDAAKAKASQIRKSLGLKWDLVKFRAERRVQKPLARDRFGVSPDGRWFTNADGQRGRMDYAPRVNPSKGLRFRGYTDAQGNFHDLD